MSKLQKIRQKIIDRDYYISSHAEEEIFDDDLERADIENAILKGKIEKKLTEDTRGTRFRMEGPSRDKRIIHVVCRFKEGGNLVIITASRYNGGNMICEFCEGKTKKKRVRRSHWLAGKLYIVENVEAEVCSECGERYFYAEVLDKIDSFLEKEHAVKERINVEVVCL